MAKKPGLPVSYINPEEGQQDGDLFLQLFTVYNKIQETMLQQELAALEPFRQVFLIVSLITRGPAKPIRLRVPQYQIAQHTERGGKCRPKDGSGKQGYYRGF